MLLTVVLGGNLYLEVTIKHSEFGMSEVLVPTKCKFLISFLQQVITHAECSESFVSISQQMDVSFYQEVMIQISVFGKRRPLHHYVGLKKRVH